MIRGYFFNMQKKPQETGDIADRLEKANVILFETGHNQAHISNRCTRPREIIFDGTE